MKKYIDFVINLCLVEMGLMMWWLLRVCLGVSWVLCCLGVFNVDFLMFWICFVLFRIKWGVGLGGDEYE